MSKKLLEEQSIRKFMKIAGLQPLTSTFLKETWEEGKDPKKKQKDEKVKEEAKEADGEKLEEVEDLEEGKEELEEGGGQMPVDSQSRREDDRDMARGRDLGEAKKMEEEGKEKVEEAKSLVAKASKMKGAPASHKMKPAKKAGGLVKEEEDAPEGMEDVEAAPEAPAADAGGLDVEGLVKELIRVITDKVPGAADVISVEDEGGESEIEMGGEGEGEPGHEAAEGEMGGEEELDEAALEQVVAETVKRVKNRLMESKKAAKPTLSKQELAKKVASKVAERLKKA